MSIDFDIMGKTLIDEHTADWAACFSPANPSLSLGPIEVVNSDLSSDLRADRLLRVNGPSPYLLHLELQSSHKLNLPRKWLHYSAAALAKNGLPVHTVVILLRPEAQASDMTGELLSAVGSGPPHLRFTYRVVRVWKESLTGLLAAGLGIAPLAILTDEALNDPKAALSQLQDRLRAEDVTASVRKDLLGSTFTLAGLRYDQATILSLYGGFDMTMEDSTTYCWLVQKIRAELEAEFGPRMKAEVEARIQAEVEARIQAEVEARIQAEVEARIQAEVERLNAMQAEARSLLIGLGTKRFGDPSSSVAAALSGIGDRNRLERMVLRSVEASGWDDLLSTS